MELIRISSICLLIIWSHGCVIGSAPIETAIPNSVGLKPIGCYNAWNGNGATAVSTSTFENGMDLEKCAEYCRGKDQPHRRSDILLIRGMYCGCMLWESFQHTRVQNDECHLKCDRKHNGLNCGGNYAFSFYCDTRGANSGRCNGFEPPAVGNHVNNNVIKDSDDRRAVLPIYDCFECTDPFDCNPMYFSSEFDYFPQNSREICVDFCRQTVESGIGPSRLVREKTTYAIVGYANKFGMPIPVCYCTDEIRSTYQEVPISECDQPCPQQRSNQEEEETCGGKPSSVFSMYCSNTELCLEEPTIVPVSTTPLQSSTIAQSSSAQLSTTDASTTTPAETSTPNPIETTNSFSSTSEASTTERGPITLSSDTPPIISTSDNTPTPEQTTNFPQPTDHTTSTPEFTIQSSSQSDISTASNTDPTEPAESMSTEILEVTQSTIVSEITSSSNVDTSADTESTIILSTEETTVDTSQPSTNTPNFSTLSYSDLPTIISTEYTFTTSQSEELTTIGSQTTTAVRPCELKCEVVEFNGQDWRACAGRLAVNPCPGKEFHDGRALWRCSDFGTFVGDVPDYSQCRSPWLDDIKIEEGEIIEAEKAQSIFDIIKSNVGQEDSESPSDYYGHEIPEIMRILALVLAQLHPETELLAFEELNERAVQICQNLITNGQPWSQLAQANRSKVGTDLIHVLENTVFKLTNRSRHETKDRYRKYYPSEAEGLVVSGGAQPMASLEEEAISFPFVNNGWATTTNDGSSITLPSGWSNVIPGKDLNFMGSAVPAQYITRIFPITITDNPKVMNGKLMSFSLANQDAVHFPKNGVEIKFVHSVRSSQTRTKDLRRKQHEGEIPKPVYESSACVYWDTYNLLWSSEGCKLLTSDQHGTVCECSHLTSFAVLMDLHNYLGKDTGLEILTLIICPLSVLCLFATIVIFTVFRSTHSPRTSITKNLCICLLLANTSILMVLDRHYFNMSDGVCMAAAIVTHYIFLAAFMWMAIEGYHLYTMVVHVFESGRNYINLYRILAFGLPLFIVGGTVATSYLNDGDAYGGEMFCWLQGNYVWAFLVPIAIVVLGNSVSLYITLRTVRAKKTPATAQAQTSARANRKWGKGILSLNFVLGLTWVVGFLMLTGSMTSVIAAYAFTILNASQGIVIFILHCLLNEKVQESAQRRNIPVLSWLSPRRNTLDPGAVSKSRSSDNLNEFVTRRIVEADTQAPPSVLDGVTTKRRSLVYDPHATVSSLESVRTGSTHLNYTSGSDSCGSLSSVKASNSGEEESEI